MISNDDKGGAGGVTAFRARVAIDSEVNYPKAAGLDLYTKLRHEDQFECAHQGCKPKTEHRLDLSVDGCRKVSFHHRPVNVIRFRAVLELQIQVLFHADLRSCQHLYPSYSRPLRKTSRLENV